MPAEKMNSANLLQLIREATPGTYNAGGDKYVMTSLRGDFAREEAWASFRPSGFNEDAWHALERTHRVWSGTIRWDFKQAHIFLRMLCGAPLSDVTATGKRTRVYTLPEYGARNLDGSTFTLEYGEKTDCERCPYGLLMNISLPAERTSETVEGQVTILCQKPSATGVTMTGAAPANETQRITFANTPADQFLQLKPTGGASAFNFKASDTTAAIKAGIEAMTEYSGRTVTITDNRTNAPDGVTAETLYSGYLQIVFDGNVNVSDLLITSGEVQKLVVTNGDGGNYTLNGGASFTLGATAAAVQTNQRALAGLYAAVVTKGVSVSGAITGYVVSGAGAAQVNGTYNEAGTLNARPYYDGPSYRILYAGTQWQIANTAGSVILYNNISTAATPPTTGWGLGASGPAPAPTVTAIAGASSATFNSYFPVSAGDVPAPTKTGTGAVVSTLQDGAIAATNAVPSVTASGNSGFVIDTRVPMLNKNFSMRKAASLASVEAASPLNKSMMMNFDLGNLVDPIWFFDENNDTFASHVDGGEPTKTLAIRLAKSSTDLVALEAEAGKQPATPAWFQQRAVHADDSKYSFRGEFFASATGAAELGAGGNVRYVQFPLATVIEGNGTAARFTITEPA